MYAFRWSELILYATPFIMVVVIRRYFSHYLVSIGKIKLTLGALLIPMWLVLIDSFSWLLYDHSIVPLWSLLTILALAFHLYDYVRVVDTFRYSAYYKEFTRIVFTSSSMMLIGIMITRVISYFF
ncbi:MAG: hypothetical protein Q4B80_05855 [Aerococcaceae bacterium]|nr:hypothetical protein [Aerococcaceae bacterium]